MLRHDICEVPASNAEPLGINGSLSNPVSADGTPELGKLYQVPAREGRAVRMTKGQTIEIINTHGTQVCDTWAFNGQNISEFLSWDHARAQINKIVPGIGDPMVTNRRRPILTMTEDTSPGVHDTLMAACDLFRYTGLGVNTYHDSCADNLRLALMAIGLATPHVPQPLNLWMNIPVDKNWKTQFLPTVSKAGDKVKLRADMDCIVAMSACPQDILAINSQKPMELHFRVLA